MKHGKYDLHKSSADLSVGTSYSWYYKKSDNPTARQKFGLTRAASDSTLFSDYGNQMALFEKEKRAKGKKCKKSASDVGKTNRTKCTPKYIKPVRTEPFTGNFYYGETLPGFKCLQKSEEVITYLPESDIITVSEANTADSVTTAATIVDIPEVIKNPLYGCLEMEVRIPTPLYSTDTTISKDSQLNSTSCSELRKTMCSDKDTDNLLTTILKDYKRIMKEWNHTIKDHYSTISHKNPSTVCRCNNTDSYNRSLYSMLSCRKPNRCLRTSNDSRYAYPYTIGNCQRYRVNENHGIKGEKLKRTNTFTNWTASFRNLKKKFSKNSHFLDTYGCECLEAIYADYDRRLQEWCDTISDCTSSLNSVYDIIH